MESFLPNNIYSYCKRSSGGARVARKKPERGHSIAVKMPSCTNLLCTQQNGCTESAKLRNKIMRYFFIKFKIGVTGFEPAASWSQTRRSSQAEPHPVKFFCANNHNARYIICEIFQNVNNFFHFFFLQVFDFKMRLPFLIKFHQCIGRPPPFLPWERNAAGV